MNALAELRQRFQRALKGLAAEPAQLVDMVRASQDPKFGDFQANCAMPLGKQLGQPPRDVAAQIVERLDVADLCHEPEIAGPGFINLRLKDDWISHQLGHMVADPLRLGIAPTDDPETIVVDYSSPNVAKPMHVGHIRSTVIGDALYRTLGFVGHKVISDNHLGDWGTQFGMIIYGYKNFVDQSSYERSPVAELGRLYQVVNRLIEYHASKQRLEGAQAEVAKLQAECDRREADSANKDKKADKKARKALNNARGKLKDARAEVNQIHEKIERVESSPEMSQWATQHTDIARASQQETARLHAGDEENQQLWQQFLPLCRQEIERIYQRLGIRFDYEYGESFYHPQLGPVVEQLIKKQLAVPSDGAMCVFLDDFDTPMIVQKKDGAYLYATTDLATLQYRETTWQPDRILYVVDFRQSEHFEKLFATARLLGYTGQLTHISFGTVLGKDNRPYRTRSGDAVGLEGLLDEAVSKALQVVSANDDAKRDGPELSEQERQHVAHVVGHAAIKYADLSHNRTSDYVFDEDKMVAMQGNTATYMQYSYARVQSIFAKGGVDLEQLRSSATAIQLDDPYERALAVQLLQLHQAIDESLEDYRPNVLTSYLFRLADQFSKFYDQCTVLKAESEVTRNSRLALCDLTGQTIKLGLALLGIDVVDKM